MKRVFITGATGFIGRHCLSRLQAAAEEVHAATKSIPEIDFPAGVHWHVVDLLHPEIAVQLIREVRPTHLLHLAWNVDEGVYWNAPENLQWLKSGIDLFEAFYNNGGQRLVVAGSCSEYNLRQAYLSEATSVLQPESLYAGCKHALQVILDAYSSHGNLSYAWGRIFFLYGPYEKPGRLVPSVIRALLSNKEARCSHGNQIRDYMHVEDVADAFVHLLGSNLQGPVNIASGEPMKLEQIIARIAALVGSRQELVRLGALPSPPNEPPVILGDVTRLRRELGWRPTYDLEDGLIQTIAWWKNNLNIGRSEL